MDIKSVIQRHGFQLQEVSAKMEVKHSTLSGMLSGNPTISTLRKIVDAINAMNEENQLADRCYLAEFFADELPEGFTKSKLQYALTHYWNDAVAVEKTKNGNVYRLA